MPETAIQTHQLPQAPVIFAPGKSPIIRNLVPGLTEVGKIKIGRKGRLVRDTFRAPEKLDHFIITKLGRDNEDNFIQDDALMNTIMDTQDVDKLTEIPVRLLFDDIALNFQCRYTCFQGRTRWCTGDGEAAFRLGDDKKTTKQIACPCERALPTYPGEDGKGKGKCKTTGCLSVLIEGAQRVGGIWKFRTTSYNSVVGILSSLTLIKRLSGGQLAGLPLIMRLQQRTAQNPLDQSQVTIYVVNIEYPGSPEALQQAGYKIALQNATVRQQILHVEEQALRLISVDAAVIDDDGEHADEFHPEDAAGNAPIGSSAPALVAPTSQLEPAPAPSPDPAAEAPQAEPKKRASKKSAPAQEPAPAPAPAAPVEPPAPPPLTIPTGANIKFFE